MVAWTGWDRQRTAASRSTGPLSSSVPDSVRQPSKGAPRMRFLHPEVGGWLAAGLALLVIARWRARGRFAAATTVARIDRSGRVSVVRRLPLLLLLAALALTACALMDPVLPFS